MWAGYRSAPNECASTTPASKQTARSELRWRLGMHTLIGLLVATAAAYAIARPSGLSTPPESIESPRLAPRTPLLPPRKYFREYFMKNLLPNYFGYEDSFQPEPPTEEHEWLNKEIDRLNRMEDGEESLTPFEDPFRRLRPQWMMQDPYMARITPQDLPTFFPNSPSGEEVLPVPPPRETMPPKPVLDSIINVNLIKAGNSIKKKESFAMSPLDKGYYESEDKVIIHQSYGPHEGGELKPIEIEPPRKIRQNPNLSRSKNLVAENLDRLKTGFTHEAPEATDKPRHINVLETVNDPADSIYGVALIAAVGAALAMAIFGFAFGWYTISKKAKAAADVDYPAYGVTGPNMDTSGDRKLAHSAHMYHYQHQKQQIIAMERNGLEQRNGSVSDLESEEENEEGDYTVYECPGFATTGEMEVKNPLFSEDPTPATPGKCELVKPQPKD